MKRSTKIIIATVLVIVAIYVVQVGLIHWQLSTGKSVPKISQPRP